jgi:hypothetical protein
VITPGAEGPAALDLLAAALGAQFSTTMIRQDGHRPRLVVADRSTGAATEVHADENGQYWWPWAAPATVTDDPQATAHQIIGVLRGTPDGGYR